MAWIGLQLSEIQASHISLWCFQSINCSFLFIANPGTPSSGTKSTYSYVNTPKKTSTMTTPSTKLLGKGLLCSILLKKLHPADRMATHFPNAIATQQLANLAFSNTTEFTRKSLLQIDVAMPISYDLAVGFFLRHSFL